MLFSGFPKLGTIDIFSWIILRIFVTKTVLRVVECSAASLTSTHSMSAAHAPLPTVLTPTVSPDVAECHLGDRIIPS